MWLNRIKFKAYQTHNLLCHKDVLAVFQAVLWSANPTTNAVVIFIFPKSRGKYVATTEVQVNGAKVDTTKEWEMHVVDRSLTIRMSIVNTLTRFAVMVSTEPCHLIQIPL